MRNPNPWSRLNRVHEYCESCKYNNSCIEWCFGSKYEQSSTRIIKRGILDRILQWIRGKDSEEKG